MRKTSCSAPRSLLTPPSASCARRELADHHVVAVEPIWIVFLDKAYLPITLPLLDVFLPGDRRYRIFVAFEPDKTIDAVPGREPRNRFGFMLINTPHEIIRHANVQSPVLAACEKVYVIGQHATSDTVIPGWLEGPSLESMNTDYARW